MARAPSPKAAFSRCRKLAFPGGALIGCAAGFVNVPRIKGSHNAMKTGMMAAEAAFAALKAGRAGDTLAAYEAAYAKSAVAKDLRLVRNAKPLWSRLGTLLALPFIGLDLWTNQLFGFSLFGTLSHGKPDYATLKKATDCTAASPIPSPTEISPSTGCPASSSPIPTMRRTSRCIWCCAIPQFRLE